MGCLSSHKRGKQDSRNLGTSLEAKPFVHTFSHHPVEVHDLPHEDLLDDEAVLRLGAHVDGVLPLVAGLGVVGVEHLLDGVGQRVGDGRGRRRLLLDPSRQV